jgi:hypothetical protein
MPKPSGNALQCPRCINSRMLEQVWNGVRFSICMSCGANFFAAGDLAAFEGWPSDIPTAAEKASSGKTANVSCPACGGAMESVRFPLDPPLVLERCWACHGIVLDFEEIRRVPAIAKWAGRRKAAKAP